MTNEQRVCNQVNGIAKYKSADVISLCQQKRVDIEKLRLIEIEKAKVFKNEVVKYWRDYYNDEPDIIERITNFIFRKKKNPYLSDDEILEYGESTFYFGMEEDHRQMYSNIFDARDDSSNYYGKEILDLCDELILACEKIEYIWVSSSAWFKIN